MDYNALKVADLKGLLKERGISSTGLSRKQQIIEALESHDAKAEGKPGAGDGTDGGDGVGEVAGEGGGGGLAEQAEQAEGEGQAVQSSSENAQLASSESKEEDGTDTTDATVTESNVQIPPTALNSASNSAPTGPPAQESTAVQPTVLEANEPISKELSAVATPRAISPLGESTSSDRKRKRRSPTPPISQETVSKKLKAAEDDVVTLPEDRGQEQEDQGDVLAVNTTQPEQVPDPAPEAMEPEQTDASEELSVAARAPAQMDGAGDTPPGEDFSRPAQQSVHSATRAIYIRHLVRPIQLAQLREHLAQLATPPGHPSRDDIIETLHLGSIRTHAFAVFASISAASRARNGLHDRIWPDEPARRPLWVDFVPEDRMSEWIDRETEGGRRDTRRWEIIYDQGPDGVVARHHEVTSSGAPGMSDQRPSSIGTSGQGMGMPNAPLGPRSSRPSHPTIPPPKQPTPNPKSTAPLDLLDERFPSTTTKPKLYYQPVSNEIAGRRLEELERQTSREWGARGGEAGGARDAIRRYTFEDGDKLVDGGPHFGDFSGPRGGGRGRGGGYRGRR